MKIGRRAAAIFMCVYTLNNLVNSQTDSSPTTQRPCYDSQLRPQRCVPNFVNAAYNRLVQATNTCGMRRSGGRVIATEFCLQTRATGATKRCDICDSSIPSKSHPIDYLTDFNNNDNMTWWQTETMNEGGIQHPNEINLTLNLGKSFDITYVRLKFHTSRPESFAIYKRTVSTGDWIPYQYYSASCRATYRKRRRDIITRANEGKAICTDEYSDISPLNGGSVAFSTLEGRPSAYNFETSAVLQDFVTATDIRIVLNRLNTFGDEVFHDPKVLKSYFYGISDFAVGGRCKCNGHASECVKSTGQGLEEILVCRCEHNTAGADCNECLPFYNDQPWGIATSTNANECKACNCNGLSNRCFFDRALFDRTGHGGHCLDCVQNAAGSHCELCKENFFKKQPENRCLACNCNGIGSETLQCASDGRCRCKQGVTGDKCDQCQANFYDFNSFGCRECQCVKSGSLDNRPFCDSTNGVCQCKDNVEGQNCDRCKPGYFNLQEDNKFGCLKCFCFGHSSVCSSSPEYSSKDFTSTFNNGAQNWVVVDEQGKGVASRYNAISQDIGASAVSSRPVYFSAPASYLGNQRASYNQFLSFDFRVGSDESPRISRSDIVLEGNGKKVSIPLIYQNNPRPSSTKTETFKYRLHEHSSNRWLPQLSSLDFISMLSNLTSIKIRATYSVNGIGIIDNVKLQSAVRSINGGDRIAWVEQCSCPKGYVGQFCESCEPGYRRDPEYGGPFARCIPCNCNGHSDTCDVNSGRCICQHNTDGINCERCKSGFYGYALGGKADDCKACPCPEGGPCVELLNGDVACTDCKEGYSGNRCEMCTDGYFGDPTGRYGPASPCKKCACNDNIDPNAVGNCNGTTGRCLKCIYNTAGSVCSECLPGYYGDAVALPKGQCKACGCYQVGSSAPSSGPVQCDLTTGQCPCLPNVAGQQCNKCIDGYWSIDGGIGCQACLCSQVGSVGGTCDINSGQCICKTAVNGLKCTGCVVNSYGFSDAGCNLCECDEEGSSGQQCHATSGQCPCNPDVQGKLCNQCVENKFNLTAGCIDCPPCYKLVQDRVNSVRSKLSDLQTLLRNIGRNATNVDDKDFRSRMTSVNESVNQLLSDARSAISAGPVATQLAQLEKAIENVLEQCGHITADADIARGAVEDSARDIDYINKAIDRAEQTLKQAELYLNQEGRKALQRAKNALQLAGQQSDILTNMSITAKDIVSRQESDAERIEKTANEALDLANEAMKLAQDTLKRPADMVADIKRLDEELSKAEAMYNATKKIGEEAQEAAVAAYDDAIKVYSTANSLMLPDVDVNQIKRNSTDIKTKAAVVQKKAEDLIAENKDLLKEVDEQKLEAKDLILRGQRQQQIADGLLVDVDAVRHDAMKAVKMGEETLRDANNTLQILKGFDDKVRMSKDKAAEAMKKVPEIEKLIQDAEKKTKQAEEALSGAVQDAEESLRLAKQAKDIAAEAAKKAVDILEEVQKVQQRAVSAKDNSDTLGNQIDDAENSLNTAKKQADEDETLAKQALEKASRAKQSAQASSENVAKNLDTVNNILRQLGSLSMIDSGKMNTLEASLDAVELDIKNMNLDQRYNDLVAARSEQEKLISQYSSDLWQLQKEVRNVQEISDSLPKGCYKRADLERPINP